MKITVNPQRIKKLNHLEIKPGPVIYWMSREQRVRNNWSLLYAQELALNTKSPLLVVFTLSNSFLGATIRQYDFMIKGLEEVEENLAKLNIPFYLLDHDPVTDLLSFSQKNKAGVIVTDFDPLRIKQTWKKAVSEKCPCAFVEVDSHNIVPCWLASNKQEFGAYTIRPKIKKLLPEFLTPYPKLKVQPISIKAKKINWLETYKILKIDNTVSKVNWLLPGEKAAQKSLAFFINHKLKNYESDHNNPNLKAQSYLSPYLHFGHLSAQDIALKLDKNIQAASFLEELIIRKELADNFCYYQENYDSVKAFPNWAKETIKKHQTDQREYLYTLTQLEKAKTHDELWNATQEQLVRQGTIPGYLRMYWAKKILEWTKSNQEALKIAIYLNDKYQLDGRDPNGYTGIAWSIGGLHDRAWFERPVFGKIRYMNYNGCKSKFDVKQYINNLKTTK